MSAFGESEGKMDRDKLRKYIVFNEGSTTDTYYDTQGHPSIGVGFNLDRSDAREKIEALGHDYDAVRDGDESITNAEAGRLLDGDIDNAVAGAQQVFDNFDQIDGTRQIVLTDLVFQLGADKVENQFPNFTAAVNNRDWSTAGDELVDSRYYDQVPNRADRNVDALTSGDAPAVISEKGKESKDGKESTDKDKDGSKEGKEATKETSDKSKEATDKSKESTDKAKDSKESKESTDKGKDASKESKEGKESTDKGKDASKEGKEGKDSTDKSKDSKETKESKESSDKGKDSKESKEGKESTDKGKEGKEGKESTDKGKDSKESKEGKDGKDSSDKGKESKDGKDGSDKGSEDGGQ